MTAATSSAESAGRGAPRPGEPSASAARRARGVELELDLFSGRPNPSSTLTGEVAQDLLQRLDRLPGAASRGCVEPPGLGYRGVTVRSGVTLGDPRAAPAEPIRVYGGLVCQGAASRSDPHRELERWLLELLRERVAPALRPAVEETLRSL